MAAVDRGALRSIASLEGIVRMVGAICWNNDRVEQAVVLFISIIIKDTSARARPLLHHVMLSSTHYVTF